MQPLCGTSSSQASQNLWSFGNGQKPSCPLQGLLRHSEFCQAACDFSSNSRTNTRCSPVSVPAAGGSRGPCLGDWPPAWEDGHRPCGPVRHAVSGHGVPGEACGACGGRGDRAGLGQWLKKYEGAGRIDRLGAVGVGGRQGAEQMPCEAAGDRTFRNRAVEHAAQLPVWTAG